MNSWPRKTSHSLRSFKGRVQNIPVQICKGFLRLTARICEQESCRFCVIFTTLCIVCCLLFGWIFYRDPCFQWEIRKSVCEDYRRGMVAGNLCYDLCIERTSFLSSCIDVSDNTVTYEWRDLILKASRTAKAFTSPGDTGVTSPASIETSIWEGMTQAQVWDVLEKYFDHKLGVSDHTPLIERVLSFADFNQDGKLNFGELRSIWQLLHIPEFHTLFIFQGNSVFPVLNNTCGTIYSYQSTYNQILYDKTQDSVLDKVFPNRFRWHFPDISKRVHIALGLLEYAYITMEAENVPFYMCDLSPKNFGYTEYYEMKVSNLQGIVSAVELNQTLSQRRCRKDADCLYGTLCRTACNKGTGFCHGMNDARGTQNPDLIKVCGILMDYIMHDLPENMRLEISLLIQQCYRMGKSGRVIVNKDVQMNIILDRLYNIMWTELKDEANPWLYKPTQRPFY